MRPATSGSLATKRCAWPFATSPIGPSESSISPYVRSEARRASRATSTASAARPLAVSARRMVTASAACCP
ncbi:hypothetical protein ACIGW4_25980 [Streptomyces sp. NPDC053513]|uniref:hypothetical protein n=1 Tax=unclassified Streptomyces TaxID=2593676 RepID=UPI0037D98ADA